MEEREIFSSLRDDSTFVWGQVDDLKLWDLRTKSILLRVVSSR